MVVALLASAVVSGTTAGTAWLIKPALDDIFIRQDGTALLYVPLAFIVLTALKGAGRYLQNWCMHYSALHVLETMRQELFQKIITLPLHFYEESQVGALMSRVINDVGMIRQSLPAFIQIIRQVITMISLLYVVFQQNFELACWAIIVLPVAGFPLSLFSRALRRYGRKNAEVNASISSMLQELLSGIRVIKAFATEKQETGRFNKENARIININFRQSCVSELSSPVMELIGAIGIGLVIWYGGREVIQGDMTPGTFFAFMGALAMLYTPFKSLNGANMNVQNALAGAERVFAILDDPALKTERGGTLPLDEPFRELTFRDVSLHYGDESTPALRGVSLTVKAGERIAFVGPSGAGKTTLVNLIPRFYDPQRGEILLNGKPLKEYSLASLRRSVSMVSQDAFLFDMTIAENIAYGRDLSSELDMDRVRSAAVAAYADGFIRELPEGYETPIGERGVRLSGGQKQRLTIARALLKDAPLLILDEATSALDSESEHMVQKALDNLMLNRTSLIIAHRLSTILGAARLGIPNLSAQLQDASAFVPDWEGAFDAVIVDAPCSGLGIIRKKPDIRYRDLKQTEDLPELQKKILWNQAGYVKKGGLLLYSTCTLLPRENEQVVQAFLETHPDFSLEALPLPEEFPKNETGMLTLIPGRHDTDGFFISRMRRKP